MKLVYFGKKRPKVIQTVSPEFLSMAKEDDKACSGGVSFIPLAGKDLKYSFIPFKEIEVDDLVGKILLDKAGDIFKQVDQGENVEKGPPDISTDGYVGDAHAASLPDMKKTQAREAKQEEDVGMEDFDKKGNRKKKSK